MEIIIIITVISVVAIIAYIIGAVNNTEVLPNCCLTCLHEHKHGIYPPFCGTGICCNHYGIQDLKDKIQVQEKMLWEIKKEMDFNLKMKTQNIYYAKTESEQRLSDIIVKGKKQAEILVKELDIFSK